MTEAEFHAALRTLPLHPGAHALADDTATLGRYTITTDTLVESVHYLPTDPPEDVAWKLLATNLSDLAAKGASPVGVLLNYPLRATDTNDHPPLFQGGEDNWDTAFLAGLSTALAHFTTALLGGDTVSLPAHAPRIITLTAIGEHAPAPPRSGARAGDALYVTGTIGDAGAGLAIALGADGPAEMLAAYRRPQPRLAEGRALAPHVQAMMDLSDGLLIDAQRMAAASNLAVEIDLARIPLSQVYPGTPLDAATAGDDYELLFAAPADFPTTVAVTCIGRFAPGTGLTLTDGGTPVPLPATLGYQHNRLG